MRPDFVLPRPPFYFFLIFVVIRGPTTFVGYLEQRALYYTLQNNFPHNVFFDAVYFRKGPAYSFIGETIALAKDKGQFLHNGSAHASAILLGHENAGTSFRLRT